MSNSLLKEFKGTSQNSLRVSKRINFICLPLRRKQSFVLCVLFNTPRRCEINKKIIIFFHSRERLREIRSNGSFPGERGPQTCYFLVDSLELTVERKILKCLATPLFFIVFVVHRK